MLENKPRLARLQTLRMMAALEQFLIDENWSVASRVTGMEEPPWGHWATQDLAAIRRQFVYTRMVEATWVGALINELKGGGVVSQEADGHSQAQGKGIRQGPEKRRKCVKMKPSLRSSDLHVLSPPDNGGDVLAWLERWCLQLEVDTVPLASYFRSTFVLPEGVSEAKGVSTDIFPCPSSFPLGGSETGASREVP